MLGEWYLPPGKCQAISTITEGIISISHPAPLSSQTRIPQTSSPLVDKSQATQAALLQIRRSETGYGAEARQFHTAQLPYSLPRLLGSLDKGLMVFCPVLALGVVGWPAFFHRFPWEAALCAGVVMGNLLLTGAWHSWGGGRSWGPRLLVPAIPLWLLPAGLAFGGSPPVRWRAWIAGLVLISVAVQVPGILVKDRQIHHIGQNMLTESERGRFPADW